MMALQIIWFVLILVLLTGYAVLDGFDLGAGFWHLFTKEDDERRIIFKAIGPFWDGNEVWLLTGGGAIFAAFPPVYASVFSGFYLAMFLVVFGLIFRAVSIEFRNIVSSKLWQSIWDVCFSIGSILPALLFGVALGNIIRGISIDGHGDYTGTFFALLNPYALLIGLLSLSMLAVHGAAYIGTKCDGPLGTKSLRWLNIAWISYIVLFIPSSLWTIIQFQRKAMIVSIFLAILVLASILAIRIFSKQNKKQYVFISSALSIIFNMFFAAATIFPIMVPSLDNKFSGLTIFNSSSSQNTLTVMLIMALIGMPIVIGYTIYIYRTFAGKIDAA